LQSADLAFNTTGISLVCVDIVVRKCIVGRCTEISYWSGQQISRSIWCVQLLTTTSVIS